MEKLLTSNIINNLKEKIEQGDASALGEFWDEVKLKGTPLIETIEGDSEYSSVTFVYKATEPIENVVCLSCIGGWEDYSSQRLQRLLDTNLWYITYQVRNDVKFNYWFSVNDSLEIDCEKRFPNSINDEFAKNIFKFKDKDISYTLMPKSLDSFWDKERTGVPKGNVHEHIFTNEFLESPRKIRVYTPYGYDTTSTPYGFLLVTDGDEHLNILSAQTILDNLICDKNIPPIVAIFIDSTENRAKELKCNDAYGNMIVDDFLPWVKNHYNISNNANECVISGFSLGGLNSSYTALKHPEVFGNALSESGSYWYNPENCEDNKTVCWLGEQFKKVDKLPIKFYMNVGVLETKDTMLNTNRLLKDILISKGYDVTYEEFKSSHDYLSWADGLANGLIALIGK